MKKTLLVIICLATSIFANAQGPNFNWAKQMGGTQDEQGLSIAIDSFGNVYTAGYYSGTVDFDPSVGIYNLTAVGQNAIFISKLDASGNFLWAKSMGGSVTALVYSIFVDADGNVYSTGIFQGTVDFDPGVGICNFINPIPNYNDMFISKLDASGNFVWAKHIGGNGNDAGFSIGLDLFGNIFTTGFFVGTVDFDPSAGIFNLTNSGSFVLKLDSLGNFVWAKNMGGVTSKSITLDVSGNIFTTGTYAGTTDVDPSAGTFNLSSVGMRDIFISKLDSVGNFLWAKSMGSSLCGFCYDEGNAIAADVFGNVYSTGFFTGTCDFDPNAGIANLNSVGFEDSFILKLDSSGNYKWAIQYAGEYGEKGYNITVDSYCNVYTVGVFSKTVDFDPGAGIYNLDGTNGTMFISKLDSLGNFMWAKNMGDFNKPIFGSSIVVDPIGNIYTTGSFEGTVDFDHTAGITNLTSVGNSDIFVHKMNQIVGIAENSNANNLNIFPNPSNGLLTIEATFPKKETLSLTLYDVLGTEVMSLEQVIAEGVYQKQINIETLPSGVYFLSIQCDNNISMKKVIKQ